MRARRLLTGAVVALGLTAASLAGLALRQQEFPHQQHANLFPLCEGCHEGVPEGNRADFYPDPAECAGCHDGTEQPRVDWRGPTDEPDNLDFTHPEHPTVDDRDGQITCSTCHTAAGAPRMSVAEEPVVPRCLACHEHRADDHYVDADCETCHVPLAVAPFDQSRIVALPEPSDHELYTFLPEVHGDLASEDITRCAVCHTRERCESCHVDAGVVDAIGSMPAATGIVAQSLPAFEARYPVPESHLDSDFIFDHGAPAASGSCSSCHTRESCSTCHISPQPAEIRAMVSRDDVAAPGVQVTRRAPPSHQAPLFEIEHGNEASANGASCSACHARTMCADCHDAALAGVTTDESGIVTAIAQLAAVDGNGSMRTNGLAGAHTRHMAIVGRGVTPAPAFAAGADRRAAAPATEVYGGKSVPQAPATAGEPRTSGVPGAFHPANFMARHSAEAYGRRLECSNCHDRRLFCADCHRSAGMSPGTAPGRLGPGFHDAEPLWLLRHGQAARQGLESCASCHGQNECMQCHSVLGAFKVNPHGPGFDARRAQQRNAAVCLVCHVTDPLSGRT